MRHRIFLFVLFCFLVFQAANGTDVYRSWFTHAAAADFTDYGYSSTQISRPDGFPVDIESTSYGTRGAGADISYSQYFTTATFGVTSLSDKDEGVISFWICPQEDGAAGTGSKEHYILQGGNLNTTTGGFRISWDNRSNKSVLLFKMAGKKTDAGNAVKLTSCQYDISGWEAGYWHHVQVAWFSRNAGESSKALGIWVDRVCVASTVFGGEEFMDYNGTDVTIGGGSANDSACYIDELLFRGEVSPDYNSWDTKFGATPIVYRDFFLTAPYIQIIVTPEPIGASDPFADLATGGVRSIPSDPWILVDKRKQFGVIGVRKLNSAGTEKVKEYLTNYEGGPNHQYTDWYLYDAKKVISWQIYQNGTPNGASLLEVELEGSVDIYTGLVEGNIEGAAPIIIAQFRDPSSTGTIIGFTTSSVRGWEGDDAKPDLGIMYVERTPRYDRDDPKTWPAANDTVYSTVYFGNFGTEDVAENSYRIKFEMATDTDNDFRLDDETWSTIGSEITDTPAVEAGEYYDAATNPDLYKTVAWTWPASGLDTGSVWIRVTLDSGGQLGEICEVNNQRTEKNNAKAIFLGYHKTVNPGRTLEANTYEMAVEDDYADRRLNIVGSFSDFDYFNAHVDRMNIMTQTTKYDNTSAVGIQDGLRVDKYIPWVWDEYYDPRDDFGDPESDGGFPEILLNLNTDDSHMDLYNIICHELGHTCLWLVDTYGSLLPAKNALAVGTPGSNEFPFVSYYIDDNGKTGIASSHRSDSPDQFLVGDTPLMDSTHMWLGRMNAGLIHYLRQSRSRDWRIWGDYTPHGTGNNNIQFYNAHGAPLKNAEVYVYPVIHYATTDTFDPNKYFPNQVKFSGLSNNTTGIYTFPTTTSNNWDDWTTTTVEGAETCVSPFDRHNGDYTSCDSTAVSDPNYLHAEQMLIKVVCRDPVTFSFGATEYHILPMSELHNAFFKNEGDQNAPGTYYIHTSLESDAYFGTPGLANAPSPNAAPVADLSATTTTVSVNTNIVIDGSNSHDGDTGRIDPLWYWWRIPVIESGKIVYKMYQTYGNEDTYTVPGGFSTPGNYTFQLYVFDGLKMSSIEPVVITVTP